MPKPNGEQTVLEAKVHVHVIMWYRCTVIWLLLKGSVYVYGDIGCTLDFLQILMPVYLVHQACGLVMAEYKAIRLFIETKGGQG